MPRRILIILGQPSSNSLCAALARTYADAARHSGAEVRLLELGEMVFDPILHHGYENPQPLEPDLLVAQADITWAIRFGGVGCLRCSKDFWIASSCQVLLSNTEPTLRCGIACSLAAVPSCW